jgi:hypothetical protein
MHTIQIQLKSQDFRIPGFHLDLKIVYEFQLRTPTRDHFVKTSQRWLEHRKKCVCVSNGDIKKKIFAVAAFTVCICLLYFVLELATEHAL